MDKIARVRQEIERRLNILTNVYAEQVERKDEEMMNYYHGKVIALEELRPFLNTLSEEPDKGLDVTDFCKPIDPGIAQCVADHWWEMLDSKEPDKSLEEAAYNYSFDSRPCIYGQVDVIDAFIAGAEWQKSQKTRGTSVVLSSEDFQALIDSHAKRVEADYKEKMLKDAVEADVNTYKDPVLSCGWAEFVVDMPSSETDKLGDKVRLIMLKEEEEYGKELQ